MRNFSTTVATLRLGADGRRARLRHERARPAARGLTIAQALHGRIRYADSTVDEPVAPGPDEVITDPA